MKVLAICYYVIAILCIVLALLYTIHVAYVFINSAFLAEKILKAIALTLVWASTITLYIGGRMFSKEK
jgi:hypothetical protein